MFFAAQGLANSHKELRRLFLLVQESLLLSQDDQALTLFRAFSDYLSAHLRFEDEHLFPLVDQALLRWQLVVYQKEHQKIMQLLQQIDALLSSYVTLQGREKRLALLELLEQQSRFVHVLEHHEQREESDVFLQVDTQLAPAELQALDQLWRQQEEQVLAPFKDSLLAADLALSQ